MPIKRYSFNLGPAACCRLRTRFAFGRRPAAANQEGSPAVPYVTCAPGLLHATSTRYHHVNRKWLLSQKRLRGRLLPAPAGLRAPTPDEEKQVGPGCTPQDLTDEEQLQC